MAAARAATDGADVAADPARHPRHGGKRTPSAHGVAFPGGGDVHDYYVDLPNKDFKPWKDVVPDFEYDVKTPFFSMLVPTVDTVRYSFVFERSVDVMKPVLFTGHSGVGKSVVIAAGDTFRAAAVEQLRDGPAADAAGPGLGCTWHVDPGMAPQSCLAFFRRRRPLPLLPGGGERLARRLATQAGDAHGERVSAGAASPESGTWVLSEAQLG